MESRKRPAHSFCFRPPARGLVYLFNEHCPVEMMGRYNEPLEGKGLVYLALLREQVMLPRLVLSNEELRSQLPACLQAKLEERLRSAGCFTPQELDTLVPVAADLAAQASKAIKNFIKLEERQVHKDMKGTILDTRAEAAINPDVPTSRPRTQIFWVAVRTPQG